MLGTMETRCVVLGARLYYIELTNVHKGVMLI